MSKIVGYAWFTGRDAIGIVVTKDEFGEKAYISSVDGLDMDTDLQLIKDYGSKFPLKEAKTIIENYGTKLEGFTTD